uniref:Major facilitator superfamily (MFS) profile domain-containing protein n=1 Tax=Oryza rufipogon TaxID=4529 RepID=A0A0E0PM54_ORYRU
MEGPEEREDGDGERLTRDVEGLSSHLLRSMHGHSACIELPAITAAGFVDEEGLQRSGGGRVTAFVALSCATAAMGGAIYGYDISTAGGCSGGGVRRVSNYCKFDRQLLTLFTSSLYIPGLLTASVPLYMAEIAVARYRGAFSNGIQFSLCLGALAATTVNFTVEKVRGSWGWRLSLALAGVPAVLLTVGAVFLPETPNSLVQQGKDRDKVKALLQKIRGVDTQYKSKG